MKTFLVGMIMSIAIMGNTGCSYSKRPSTLPPGQAKKVTGAKSAKSYAPGQMKKRH